MPRKGRKINDIATLWLPSRAVAKELGTTTKVLREMIRYQLIQEGEHWFRGTNKFRNYLYHIDNLRRDWPTLVRTLKRLQTLGRTKVQREVQRSREYQSQFDGSGYPEHFNPDSDPKTP